MRTYPDELQIDDAELIGNTIRVIGSKNTYNGFGYITTSVPLSLDFDTNGNVLQVNTITGPSTSPESARIFKDNSGNYYITGYNYQQGNYVCKINSANSVVWCKRFRHTNDFSTITINDGIVLANGNIVLAGSFYNYSTSFGSVFLYQLSPSGEQISAVTNDVYNAGFLTVSQMSDGNLIATGSLRQNEQAFSRMTVMQMDANFDVSWAKLYTDGFAVSKPFVKSQNDWYFTAFHNNYTTDNNPILFNTDNNGVTSCPYTEIEMDFIGVNLSSSFINLALTPTTSLLGTPTIYDPFTTGTQAYSDACLPNLAVSEIAAADDLIVYPNPSKGEFRVVSSSEIKLIEVVNALGQIVKTFHPNQLETALNIENNGVYFMKVQTAVGTKSVKVVVSK